MANCVKFSSALYHTRLPSRRYLSISDPHPHLICHSPAPSSPSAPLTRPLFHLCLCIYNLSMVFSSFASFHFLTLLFLPIFPSLPLFFYPLSLSPVETGILSFNSFFPNLTARPLDLLDGLADQVYSASR